MFIDGKGCCAIANHLHSNKIPTPYEYAKKHGRFINWNSTFGECFWNASTVSMLLQKQEYVGDTVNFRTKKLSYKSKKIVRNDKSDYAIFLNTHEPIIEREQFEIVQRLMNSRKKVRAESKPDPLRGLIVCADCGSNMYIVRRKDYPLLDCYMCGRYKRSRELCTHHRILVTDVFKVSLSLSSVKMTKRRIQREQSREFFYSFVFSAQHEHDGSIQRVDNCFYFCKAYLVSFFIKTIRVQENNDVFPHDFVFQRSCGKPQSA